MSRRIPQNYTILISCTGRAPITLSFQPKVVLGLALLIISIPAVWIGSIIYGYAEKNSSLSEQNSDLTEQASDILEQVETLEAEIDHLQERAGLPQEPPPNGAADRPQGGIATPVDAALMLETAKAQLPGLVEVLKGEVQPALEDTLDREAARPSGIPMKGNVSTSSGFGLRANPFGRGFEFHEGLDFKAAYGSPVYATAPGIVVEAGVSGGYGNRVIVDHGYGYRTLYAHLSKIAVTQGMRVDGDRVIGFLGNTGRSTGPHLHYSVYRNGQAVDPKDYLN